MREPYIALYIADNALHFEKKLPTELNSREIFEVPIEQLIFDDFNEASRKLGSTVLDLFQLWHRDLFIGWKNATHSAQESSVDNFTIALHMIDRFSNGCSEDRLNLIDEILADAATSDAEAQKYLNEEWPYLRKRLLS